MISAPHRAIALTAKAALLDMDATLGISETAVERLRQRQAERASQVAGGTVLSGYELMAVLLPDRPVEPDPRGARLPEDGLFDSGTEDVIVVPGAGAFMAMATLQQVPHAMVTCADDGLLRSRMRAAGLPLPEVLVTAESVSATKPDAEGFLRAAAELDVPAAECVVLSDSPAGITAATAAGMRVIAVGQQPAPSSAPKPAAHAPTLAQVQADPLAGDDHVRFTVTAAPSAPHTAGAGSRVPVRRRPAPRAAGTAPEVGGPMSGPRPSALGRRFPVSR